VKDTDEKEKGRSTSNESLSKGAKGTKILGLIVKRGNGKGQHSNQVKLARGGGKGLTNFTQ